VWGENNQFTVIQGLIHSGLYMQDCAIYKSCTLVHVPTITAIRISFVCRYDHLSDRIDKSSQPRLFPVIYHALYHIPIPIRHLPLPRPACLSRGSNPRKLVRIHTITHTGRNEHGHRTTFSHPHHYHQAHHHHHALSRKVIRSTGFPPIPSHPIQSHLSTGPTTQLSEDDGNACELASVALQLLNTASSSFTSCQVQR
jgi:hypothetical protein